MLELLQRKSNSSAMVRRQPPSQPGMSPGLRGTTSHSNQPSSSYKEIKKISRSTGRGERRRRGAHLARMVRSVFFVGHEQTNIANMPGLFPSFGLSLGGFRSIPPIKRHSTGGPGALRPSPSKVPPRQVGRLPRNLSSSAGHLLGQSSGPAPAHRAFDSDGRDVVAQRFGHPRLCMSPPAGRASHAQGNSNRESL